MTTYQCSACLATKPTTDFYQRRSSKRGHRTWCKDCEKQKVKTYQASPRGKEVLKTIQANQKTPECRERINSRRRVWRERNIEKVNQRERDAYWRDKANERKRMQLRANNLKYFHGIKLEDYETMERQQDGKCGICGGPPLPTKSHRRFHVDHDHKTGKIRGLLCFRCNGGLGLFLDNREVLLSAAKYLEGHASNQ